VIRAILCCVHANLEALEAVLAHAKGEGVSQIVSLGDVVGIGRQPRECLKRLSSCEISILGNHEDTLLHGAEPSSGAMGECDDGTRAALTSPGFDAAESEDLWRVLGRMQRIVDEGDVMYTHGSPRLPTKEYVVPQDARDVEKMRGVFELVKRVCFIGHSHVPHLYLSDGTHQAPERIGGEFHLASLGNRKALVNVGSVGQSRDGDPRASYVTFDGETVRWHRIEFRGSGGARGAGAPRA
jgi:predicted phosphodiesterase